MSGGGMSLSGALLFWAAALAGEAGEAPAGTDLSAPGAPASNPGTWMTNGDYPVDAMLERREGTTGFRVTYGASGAPEKCEIVSGSGHADLDATTCRLVMERAWFRPGKDRAGKLVGGTYTNRIRWTIPEGWTPPGGTPGQPNPVPFTDPGRLTVEFTVDAVGAVEKCEGQIDGLFVMDGRPVSAGDPCREIRAMAPYAPPSGADGKPVARRYRMTMEVSIDDVPPSADPAK
jgi:hypothetical protein